MTSDFMQNVSEPMQNVSESATVQQISVYLENKRGTLCDLLTLLAQHSVNLYALNVADTADFGIVRLITKSSDVNRATEMLLEAGLLARVNPMVCIKIPHEAGSMATVLKYLDTADVSIEYAYSFFAGSFQGASILLRPSNLERCLQVLQEAQVEIITQEDVDRL